MSLINDDDISRPCYLRYTESSPSLFCFSFLTKNVNKGARLHYHFVFIFSLFRFPAQLSGNLRINPFLLIMPNKEIARLLLLVTTFTHVLVEVVILNQSVKKMAEQNSLTCTGGTLNEDQISRDVSIPFLSSTMLFQFVINETQQIFLCVLLDLVELVEWRGFEQGRVKNDFFCWEESRIFIVQFQPDGVEDIIELFLGVVVALFVSSPVINLMN